MNEKSGYKNVVIYSSLFGNYEQIREPINYCEDYKYIMFTDNPNLKSDHWNIHIIENSLQNTRRMSRLPKILPHRYLPEHDFSIYIDANVQLLADDIYHMIDQCLEGKDIAIPKHPRRNCLYDELEHCVKVQKEKPEIAARSKDKYLKEGFPRHFGLYVNRFIIRKNTDVITKLNEMWWKEYFIGSERDQGSLMYCLWKLGITVNAINVKKAMEKPYYRVFRHFH